MSTYENINIYLWQKKKKYIGGNQKSLEAYQSWLPLL